MGKKKVNIYGVVSIGIVLLLKKKVSCFYKMCSRNPYFLYEPENN